MIEILSKQTSAKSRRTISRTASISAATHCRLDAFLRQQTQLWNAALEERIDAYRKAELSISSYDQYKSLTQIRRDDYVFAQFHADTQRSVLKRLDKAFKRFFKHKGFPRFKSSKRGVRSFDISQPIVRQNGLWVKGIGLFRVNNIPENIKAARVVKTACRVTVQFICEVENKPRIHDAPIGIDMGIKQRATLSTGEMIEGIRLDRRRLKRKQHKLSRAVKWSNTRRKKVKALAKEYERVKVRERNALHRLTTDITSRHNRIAVEDLQIQNMVKNKHLSRSITEQMWGTFTCMLSYKAESAGGEVVKVAPQHTSTTCSGCGKRRPMPLSARTYACECGIVIDRDVNAAVNILKRGITVAGWKIDHGGHPGASENVKGIHVTALAGQDAERHTSRQVCNFLNS